MFLYWCSTFTALTLLVRHQEEHLAHKIEWWGVIWLSVWSEVQIIFICSSWCHCIPKPHNLLPHLSPGWFAFLVPAYTGCSGKEADMGVVVVVVVLLQFCLLFSSWIWWRTFIVMSSLSCCLWQKRDQKMSSRTHASSSCQPTAHQMAARHVYIAHVSSSSIHSADWLQR